MKNIIRIAIISAVMFFSCTSKPTSLSDQLKSNFQSHLNKIDSLLVLDSFRIQRIDTANQRLFRIIDDTMYRTVLARVKSQMESATKNNDVDSMAFYQTELDYMIPTSDSMRKVISTSDTTKKFGVVAICEIQVSKKDIHKSDKIYYFLNRSMTIMNSEFIDSSIARISRTLD